MNKENNMKYTYHLWHQLDIKVRTLVRLDNKRVELRLKQTQPNYLIILLSVVYQLHPISPQVCLFQTWKWLLVCFIIHWRLAGWLEDFDKITDNN